MSKKNIPGTSEEAHISHIQNKSVTSYHFWGPLFMPRHHYTFRHFVTEGGVTLGSFHPNIKKIRSLVSKKIKLRKKDHVLLVLLLSLSIGGVTAVCNKYQ